MEYSANLHLDNQEDTSQNSEDETTQQSEVETAKGTGTKKNLKEREIIEEIVEVVYVEEQIIELGDESVKSRSNVNGFEGEESKEDIKVNPSKKAKKKKVAKDKKPVAESAPKVKKEEKFKLKKLEVDEEFWRGYDSDASSGSDAESLKEYTKDGYHPVHVGETFKNKYRILKKLGWGAFSTVWFAHDMQQNKFVAIKVQKSGESYYSAAEDEIEILEVIAEKWSTDEWKKSIKQYSEVSNINSCHCMHMMDHFEFEGPNGKHIGMVFEVMGANLLKIMKLYDWNGIPVPIVRTLAKQLLIGLDYLHRLCNVIHTDIKPENAIL